jgi:hypothetical protein
MSDVERCIQETDAGLVRLCADLGIDLDELCRKASKAFVPDHKPGDPVLDCFRRARLADESRRKMYYEDLAREMEEAVEFGGYE